MTQLITIERTGRYTAFWNRDSEAVEIRHQNLITPIASWIMDPDLQDVSELIANEHGEAGPLTADEILFILHTATTVNVHSEYAESDLNRHGAIGITY